MMGDILVSTPSIASFHLNSLLSSGHPSSPNRHDVKTPTVRNTKSTPHLRQQPPSGPLSWTTNGLGALWQGWREVASPEERKRRRVREDRRQILRARMKGAETYSQWEEAAAELDRMEGNDIWKHDDSAPAGGYNPALIAERLRELNEARTNCDIPAMMHLIRTALSRDLGGMDSVDLYRNSYVGTKKLIESYVEATISTIDAVISQSSFGTSSLEDRDLLDGMLYSRQSFGRSALLLSGGGTFGMSHVGVLKSLFEANLLPRIISGSSAGSIVCAGICTRTDQEIPELIRSLPYGDLAVFEEVEGSEGVLGHLRRLLTEGSWSDIQHLTRMMRDLTGDLTFQEAYNRTRRILNICVSSASIYELPRLLNYITAPNVLIWSAVTASCSVPLVFNSVPLLVKDPLTGEHLPWNPSPQRWIDGSVDNDLPMTRLAEMFNVNHFIVSQVNPHVVPFLVKDDFLSPDCSPDQLKPLCGEECSWVHNLTAWAKDEALHRLHILAELGICTNLADKFRSILSQKYSGDITIIPEMNTSDLAGLLANPTTEFMLRASLSGEKATWPKLSRIRDRCAIELALDRAVHHLRARVVFSETNQDISKHRCSISSIQLHGRSMDYFHEHKQSSYQRRKSGGSIPSMATELTLLDDDENAQREGMLGFDDAPPMHAKYHASTLTHAPVLYRASKSHIQVPQY